MYTYGYVCTYMYVHTCIHIHLVMHVYIYYNIVNVSVSVHHHEPHIFISRMMILFAKTWCDSADVPQVKGLSDELQGQIRQADSAQNGGFSINGGAAKWMVCKGKSEGHG